MKHDLMLPQDTIRVLPPEDGQEACVELFCERVAIYFPVETLTVTRFTGVLVDRAREDALGLCGPDALFGMDYLVLLPQSHPEFAAFDAAIRPYVPEIKTKAYSPLTCDQNGHHHD